MKMSGYRCVNYYDLCRLCTSSTGGSKINIFSSEGKKKNLIQKISDSLPIVIDENDKLPKVLCEQCLQQVESINDYRIVCLNSQAMLLGCLNTTTLQNGGKVYIKESNPKMTTISNITTNNNSIQTQNSDILSSIIQAVGLQNDELQEIKTTSMIPQYTVTMDSKTLKSANIEYKIQEVTPNLQQQQEISEKQAKHNSLAEFLKMKPNIRVTPIKKKQQQVIQSPPQVQIVQHQQQPQTITIKSEAGPKTKKTKYNLVLTSPNKQGQTTQIIQPQISQSQHQQQQQQATIIPSTAIQQTQQQQINKTVTVPDWKFVTPNSKCFLPITIKDGNSDQQIVAHIDTKNLVLPTTYHLKLQPQITTVDGQQIVQLTPTAIPATISLASSQTISTQQYQQQQLQEQNHHQIITGGSIDVSTSTNDQEIILSSNQLQNQTGITIQQLQQATTIQQQQPQLQQHQNSISQLQIKTIPLTSIGSGSGGIVTNHQQQQTHQQITLQKQSNNAITVQRINTSGVINQQQQQQGTVKIRTTKLTAAQAKQVAAAQINATKKAAIQRQQQQQQQQQVQQQQQQIQQQQQQQVQQQVQQQQQQQVQQQQQQVQQQQQQIQQQQQQQVLQQQVLQQHLVQQQPVQVQQTQQPQQITLITTKPGRKKMIKKENHPISIISTANNTIIQSSLITAQETVNNAPTTTTATVVASTTTQPQTDMLECNVCSRAFKKKEHLSQHLKLHVGLRPFKCTEQGCSKAFSRKEHLMRHIVSHTGKKMFNCDLCQKFFSRKDNLNKHKRTHSEQGSGNNGQFVCDVCNKTFVVKMYYIQHKLLHEKNGQTAGTVKLKNNIDNTNMVNTTEDNTIEEISSQIKLEQDQQQQQHQQQHHQIVQLQLPVVTSSDIGNNTITISQADGTTTTHPVLKSLGSHDTTVLNLPQGFANYVQINSGQFVNTSTGEIMGHIKLEK